METKNFVCDTTQITPLENGGYIRDVPFEEMIERLLQEPYQYGRFMQLPKCPYKEVQDIKNFYKGMIESAETIRDSLISYKEGRYQPLEEFIKELTMKKEQEDIKIYNNPDVQSAELSDEQLDKVVGGGKYDAHGNGINHGNGPDGTGSNGNGPKNG